MQGIRKEKPKEWETSMFLNMPTKGPMNNCEKFIGIISRFTYTTFIELKHIGNNFLIGNKLERYKCDFRKEAAA
jgi:hypothetical protein